MPLAVRAPSPRLRGEGWGEGPIGAPAGSKKSERVIGRNRIMGHRDRTGGRARLHLVIWLELGQDLGLPGGGGSRSTFPRRALSLVTFTAKWARAALPPRTASGDSGKPPRKCVHGFNAVAPCPSPPPPPAAPPVPPGS